MYKVLRMVPGIAHRSRYRLLVTVVEVYLVQVQYKCYENQTMTLAITGSQR